jgi:Skp family chaperone for outer membrane proteins
LDWINWIGLDWATSWAAFSQTHLVALAVSIMAQEKMPAIAEINFNKF